MPLYIASIFQKKTKQKVGFELWEFSSKKIHKDYMKYWLIANILHWNDISRIQSGIGFDLSRKISIKLHYDTIIRYLYFTETNDETIASLPDEKKEHFYTIKEFENGNDTLFAPSSDMYKFLNCIEFSKLTNHKYYSLFISVPMYD